MWKEQWHFHCRLSHARRPHTRKLWGTKQCKTAGKMTTSLLNLPGTLMLEVKILLLFSSGKYLVILWGVFFATIYIYFLISLQVIHSLKSIHPFQSCITGIFAVEENPVLSLLKVSSCHCWGGEVLQSHVRCSQRAQASSRSQFNSRFPERTQKGLLSHRESASKGSPHPLQCSSFSVWLMCYRRASLDHKWDV